MQQIRCPFVLGKQTLTAYHGTITTEEQQWKMCVFLNIEVVFRKNCKNCETLKEKKS